MLNLYEILEVSEKASKEVIDKAYRVLAKKYHPDLQEETQKQEAERKMKQINEAYDILGNEEKRKQYDMQLEQEKLEEKQKYEQQYAQQYEKNQVEDDIQAHTQNEKTVQSQPKEQSSLVQNKYQNTIKQDEYENMQKIQHEINKAYNDAYYAYLRRLRI